MKRSRKDPREHIRNAFYKKLSAVVPIFCVDVVAEDAQQKRFIIVHRRNEPARGKWWIPGGRVLKDEPVRRAAVRKLKEETGVRGTFVRVIGFYEFFARKGIFKGIRVHTPVAVCLVRVAHAGHMRLDRQSDAGKWVTQPVGDMSPELRRIIRARHRRW